MFDTLGNRLGPYAPGFALWSRLPGFSFFRAPARWGLAMMLALSLLAGKGFDAWRTCDLPYVVEPEQSPATATS